jgi:predicted DNA repair protein MutK
MFSLLSLLDDIAATLDDVAVMTKVAVKKTSALMSDDLAVNTGVVHGVQPNRELPMVWKIFVGSLLNKVYCIAGVLILMAVYPPLIKVILVAGGVYLSYEGAHKVHEKLFHKDDSEKQKRKEMSIEQKIKGAVRTDLILSVEIIVIAYSSIANVQSTYLTRAFTLCVIGVLASILIYGSVALLVKIDDFGLLLMDKGYKSIGNLFVQAMPWIMKGLGIVGTAAMFLVGGGIIGHIFHIKAYMPETLQNLVVGILVGALSLGVLSLIPKKSK